jgi:ATP-dependent helicase HrpB
MEMASILVGDRHNERLWSRHQAGYGLGNAEATAVIREVLPVDGYLDQIRREVVSHAMVAVEAPPGTGKTTRVAPMLADIKPGARTYLVQPRRLAARSVAERIAYEDGTRVGDRIGYSVRFDHRVGKQTQLIVATEGVLIRKLLQDPALQDVGVVILDEFHERSLDGDLLLGMLRRVQNELREDLRIVFMSATLDAEWFTEHLKGVPCVRIENRGFPVRVEYRPLEPRQSLIEHTVAVTAQVAERTEGDILVFMPGASEIHRTIRGLDQESRLRGFEILPLMGSMRLEEQARAIESTSRRRIVVSTNIAETSLTIPGVRTVIDSGLARVLRFAPSLGLDRLELENISSASATQRAGRAGRLGPGLCIRLWSEVSDRARSAFLEPEIRRVDLSGARLQLYAWGEGSGDGFPWLETPRVDAWESAGRVLEVLDAVEEGRITEVGEKMSRLPLHPRLGRMCIEAELLGCLREASLMAAMLSERDPFDRVVSHRAPTGMHTQATRSWESDCVERLHWMSKGRDQATTPFGRYNANAAKTIEQVARQIEAIFDEPDSMQGRFDGGQAGESSEDRLVHPDVGVMRALLAGFPDRLAKRRNSGKPQGVMVGGKGVQLSPQTGLRSSELFLCIDVEGQKTDAMVRQASGVRPEWLVGKHAQTRDELFFHPTQRQVVGRRRSYWLDLCLQETPVSIRNEDECAKVLYQAVLTHWESVFPKEDVSVLQWIERVRCLREWVPELRLPAMGVDELQQVAENLCRGNRSLDQVRSGAWLQWLGSLLSQEQLRAVQQEVPERMEVPSGSSIRIEYQQGKPPVLAVKIQEVFSWKETPRIARGRVPLLLHLLAPNGRPQQVTDDLSSFWSYGYAEVKKELKRRYPKHSWPEDPWSASPTRR